MKKFILISLAAVLSVAAFAQKTKKSSDIVPLEQRVEACVPEKGIPNVDFAHKGYTLGYNPQTRMPNYVSYILTKKEAKAYDPDRKVSYRLGNNPLYNGDRAMASDFKEDERYVPAQLAPVEDMMWDETALQETFYMTNVAPMNKFVYDGIWYELEQKCRYWAKKYGDLYIATGPLSITGRQLAIEGSELVAPDAFFKLLLQKRGDRWTGVTFIIPNTRLADPTLKKYMFAVASFYSVGKMEPFVRLDLTGYADRDFLFKYNESDWDIPDWEN